MEMLDAAGSRYRVIDHPPEGRTELVSEMRGNPVEAAAKCLMLMVKQGKRVTRYVLAVLPGDQRVDFAAIRALYEATFVSFAAPEITERLAGSVIGTVLPIPFDELVELIVDPGLLEHQELYFNAARLDRSLALRTSDYIDLVSPRIERIAHPRDVPTSANGGM